MTNEIVRVAFTGASSGIKGKIGEIIELDWSQVDLESKPSDLVEATLIQLCDEDSNRTRNDILHVAIFKGTVADRHVYKQDPFWEPVEFSTISATVAPMGLVRRLPTP